MVMPLAHGLSHREVAYVESFQSSDINFEGANLAVRRLFFGRALEDVATAWLTRLDQ